MDAPSSWFCPALGAGERRCGHWPLPRRGPCVHPRLPPTAPPATCRGRARASWPSWADSGLRCWTRALFLVLPSPHPCPGGSSAPRWNRFLYPVPCFPTQDALPMLDRPRYTRCSGGLCLCRQALAAAPGPPRGGGYLPRGRRGRARALSLKTRKHPLTARGAGCWIASSSASRALRCRLAPQAGRRGAVLSAGSSLEGKGRE